MHSVRVARESDLIRSACQSYFQVIHIHFRSTWWAEIVPPLPDVTCCF
jgi:hypothetical protein